MYEVVPQIYHAVSPLHHWDIMILTNLTNPYSNLDASLFLQEERDLPWPTGHKIFDQYCYNVSHQCWITVEI